MALRLNASIALDTEYSFGISESSFGVADVSTLDIRLPNVSPNASGPMSSLSGESSSCCVWIDALSSSMCLQRTYVFVSISDNR